MLLLGDVEELVLVNSRGRALALQLEHHHTSIVTGGEQVHLRVGSNNPKSVLIPLERLDRGTLVEIPDTDCLVFANGEDEVLVGVEQTGGSILEVAATGIDFPCLGIYILEAISITEIQGIHNGTNHSCARA